MASRRRHTGWLGLSVIEWQQALSENPLRCRAESFAIGTQGHARAEASPEWDRKRCLVIKLHRTCRALRKCRRMPEPPEQTPVAECARGSLGQRGQSLVRIPLDARFVRKCDPGGRSVGRAHARASADQKGMAATPGPRATLYSRRFFGTGQVRLDLLSPNETQHGLVAFTLHAPAETCGRICLHYLQARTALSGIVAQCLPKPCQLLQCEFPRLNSLKRETPSIGRRQRWP